MEPAPPSSDESASVEPEGEFEKVEEVPFGPPTPYQPQRWGTRPHSTSLSPLALPTSTIRELRAIDPALAKEAFEMLKNEAAHRREQEKQESAAAIEIAKTEALAKVEDMRSGYAEARIGQLCAVVIGLGLTGCAAYMGTHGAQILAGLVGTGGLATVITPFLLGRKHYRQPDIPSEKPAQSERDQLEGPES